MLLRSQIKMLEAKSKNTEIRELWKKLVEKIPGFFENVEVVPALLHGDLWSGNKAEVLSKSYKKRPKKEFLLDLIGVPRLYTSSSPMSL